MISCEMNYNNVSKDGKYIKLICKNVGEFDVFSGASPMTNIAECAFKINAALPPGNYWIVDRPFGSIYGEAIALYKDWENGTNHREWFGLYNDITMSDSLFVNGVERGGFRLHPLRPDGSGVSWGCITFRNISDFQELRSALLTTQKMRIKNKILAYGNVIVTGSTDYAKCKE
ncbi:DUF2778 domain-containing protein [Snodgrassella sp. ESL0323]|nr:DUF2778 domain-containing protein [Snodgrassella sp. ESL0323]